MKRKYLMTRNIELFGLKVEDIIGEEIGYDSVCLYTNNKYRLTEIDIIFDSIQELKEYLSFPYKVETYKGFDIYRQLMRETDLKVFYYLKDKVNNSLCAQPSYNIESLKELIDSTCNKKYYNINKYSLGNSKEIKFTTKGSVKISSENGITTVIINE